MPQGFALDDHISAQVPLLPLDHAADDEEGGSTTRRKSHSHSQSLLKAFLHYTPLHHPQHGRKSPRRRAAQCFTILIVAPMALLVCAIIWWGGIPRSYASIRRFERNLPQHRWTEVKVDSSGELVKSCGTGKFDWSADAGDGYLRFPNHLWGHGFNNVLEESILSAQLAHLSNRAYVFEDYVWSHIPLPYTLYDFSLRPTRVPLNAFVSGFIAGANVSGVHPSISSEYYHHVCPSHLPEEHRVVLSVDDAPPFADGIARMEWWVNRIKTLGKGKRCVEIRDSDDAMDTRLFDFNFFGSHEQIAPLVPKLLDSPVLKHFSWSPLVNSAVKRMMNILGLSGGETIPGLLAVHLRRGDYSRHCARLARWQTGYMGFNLADGIKDRLDPKEAWREEEAAARRAERKAKPARQREEVSGGLERRWWYWAGRAGQRLATSADAGTLANTAAGATGGSRVAKPSKYQRPTPTTERIVYGSDGVTFKKDNDFGRSRGGLGGLHQEVIALFDDVTNEAPEVAEPPSHPKGGKKKSKKLGGKEAPARWMWWGGGSKKGGGKREHDEELLDEILLDDLDLDEDILDRRSFADEDGTFDRRGSRREAVERYYFKHCLPDVEQVVQRAREVKDDWALTHHAPERQPLNRILLLSNGWPSFLKELATALRRDGWDVVDPDGGIRKGRMKDVDVAVDMALAQKAEVFLGNGFSTLSGNVVLLRMADGEGPEGNRLL